MKTIPIYDLFHIIAMDTAGPLPKTKSGNKYILVAIDHYSKWCETKAVVDHGTKTAARFLEDDIVCRYGVPKFVLTDNGGEWAAEFDVMCKDYAIQHQRTAPQWPQCNGMAERMIKTIKHGITILAVNPANVDCWDEHLAKILFGYRCGIQASTKFSPFMILTGRSPRLKADNYLNCCNPTLAKCGGEAQHLERVGIWSPPGLPNVESSIARGKTPCIGVFLVSLERS